MIAPSTFLRYLSEQGISFLTGVPDSLFKDFLLYAQENAGASEHIIAANEGHAIAIASGYHLATGKIPLVYMQNSGLGNAVNPLTSLADKEVYSIPLLLMIGWRGMPGTRDEPQHIKMGKITEGLLRLLEIPFFVLQGEPEEIRTIIENAAGRATQQQQPVALLVPANIFEEYASVPNVTGYPLSREQVLRHLLESCSGDETIICTTGKTGREFYEIAKELPEPLPKYFLSVGAMGLASQLALGINMHRQGRIIMVDGDGALLMHLGALPSIGKWASESFIYIVINNGSHESVGGQPTLGFDIDFCLMAEACGFDHIFRLEDHEGLSAWLEEDFLQYKKQFVEIRVNIKSRNDLQRPAESPLERKQALMRSFNDTGSNN